jgi:hypothetical protein
LRNTLVALALAAALPAAAGAAAGPPALSDVPESRVEVPPDALERQRQLVSAMSEVKVRYDDLGGVRRLSGDTGLFLGDPSTAPLVADHGALALDLLGPMLLANGSERLTVQTVRDAGPRERLIIFDESIRGIPVLGGLAVSIDTASGHVTGLGSSFLPDRGLPEKPAFDTKEARRLLEEALVGSTYAQQGSVSITGIPMLAYAKSQEDGRPALVWLVDAAYTSPWEGPREKRFWVHAVTGRVEGKSVLSHTVFDGIWTANGAMPNPFSLPTGTVPLNPTSDAHAQAAIASLAITEAVFEALGIPSIGRVRLLLNYGQGWPNARHSFASNAHWIILGNGGNPPVPLIRDVIAHEWGHGFYNAQLGGRVGSTFESLSIAEGYADLAAVVVDARTGVRDASWQIAEGINGPLGLRSWSNPRGVSVPTRDWYPLRKLSGDEHLNATILGHAFYLLTRGGTHAWAGTPPVPAIQVPALGYERARDIFMSGLLRSQFVDPDSFTDARDATVSWAAFLDSIGAGPGNATATAEAWRAVGVGYNCTVPPGVPNLDLGNFFCRGRYHLTWPPVAGATTYHAEIVPPGWPWTLSQPIVDGPVNSCRQNVPRTMEVHIRACNGCGCSPFSPTDTMYFYSPCL